MCNGTPFTIEKISLRAGIELGSLDPVSSGLPTLSFSDISISKITKSITDIGWVIIVTILS